MRAMSTIWPPNIVRTRCMALTFCLVIACSSAPIVTTADSVKKSDGGWTGLLAGDSLETHWTTSGQWSLDDRGVVTLQPKPGDEGWARFDDYLWSRQEYEDFEIEFDYQVQPRGNSGFYFHVGDKTSPVEKGIEVQIYDSFGKPPQEKLTDHDSGGIIPGGGVPGIPPSRNATRPAGKWNRFRIRVIGDQLTVILNEKVVNEVSLKHPALANRPAAGHIGFQDHGMPLKLRRLRIRQL